MKHGDFTELAQYYSNRPGYSITILNYIKKQIAKETELIKAADVGAGTGKLTENLSALGITGYAVEPNDAMREEGMKIFQPIQGFEWRKGSAEITNLPDNCVDWVLMGSSFHWTDYQKALKEFHRILKPEGYFTAIWNPRNIKKNSLFMDIEEIIYREIPNMNRVSSGRKITMDEMTEKLLSTSYFKELIFMEAPHQEVMSKERYLNTWRSVNDIQVQAGPDKFEQILKKIEEKLKNIEVLEVPYLSRAWTVKVRKESVD